MNTTNQYLLSFKNQRDTLDPICSPMKPRRPVFMICNGLPQYGKTRLLRQIQEENRRRGCAVSYIELQVQDDAEAIIEKVRNGLEVPDEHAPLRAMPRGSMDELVKHVAITNKDTYLLFDNLDRLSSQVDKWLTTDFVDRLIYLKVDVRLIFAGDRLFPREHRKRFRPVHLRPLEREHISESLREIWQENRQTPIGTDIRRTARFIERLSCGHPGLVAHLAQLFSDGTVFLPDSPEYSGSDRVEHEKQVFQDFILERYDDIRAAIPDNPALKLHLDFVTTLRTADVGRYVEFLRQCLEPVDGTMLAAPEPNERVFDVLSDQLTQRYLANQKGDTVEIEPVLRSVVQNHLRISHPDRYQKLHKAAQQMFGRSALAKVRKANMGRNVILHDVREGLFHLLCTFVPGRTGVDADIVEYIADAVRSMRTMSTEVVLAISDEEAYDEEAYFQDKLYDQEIQDLLEDIDLSRPLDDFISAAIAKVNAENRNDEKYRQIAKVDDLLVLYQRGIAAVLDDSIEAGEIVGTAFVIQHDSGALGFTCSHVLKTLGRKVGSHVTLRHVTGGHLLNATVTAMGFPRSGSHPEDWVAHEDIAVLRISDWNTDLTTNRIPLSDQRVEVSAPLTFFGFTSSQGSKGDWIDATAEREVADGFMRLSVKNESIIAKGMSGSPVLDTSTMTLVGMLNALDRGGRRGHYIPSTLLLDRLRKPGIKECT